MIGALAVSLVACVSTPQPPVIKTVEVDHPVAVPCIDAMPEQQMFMPVADLLALPNGQAVNVLRAERPVRDAYEKLLEDTLKACVQQPGVSGVDSPAK